MSFSRPALVVLALFSIPAFIAAQQPPPASTPQRDPRAVALRDPQALAVIQTALTAMGGEKAMEQVRDLLVQGQTEATPGDLGKTGSIMWKTVDNEFRIDFTSPGETSTLVSGHGTPTHSLNNDPKKIDPGMLRSFFVPVLIGSHLRKLIQNPNSSFELGGNSSIRSRSATLVKINSSVENSVQSHEFWYFDTATGLPLRVQIRLPNTQGRVSDDMDLSDYRLVSGVLYPFRIATSHMGQQVEIITIKSVLINTNIAPQEFDPAGGAR